MIPRNLVRKCAYARALQNAVNSHYVRKKGAYYKPSGAVVVP